MSIYIMCSILATGFMGFLVFEGIVDEGSVEAAIIYVDTGGGGHYTTIQAAVDNANPGDTIIVANGTYYESVVINKSNIKLIGNSSINCKIIHTYYGSDILNDYSAGILIKAQNVNVSGFNINVSGRYNFGIRLNSSSSSNSSIIDNIIIANYNCYNLYLYQSSNNIIKNNIINSTGYSDYNIYLQSPSSNNKIIDNIINNNCRWGHVLYISSPGSANLDIINNKIKYTKDNSDIIYIYNSSNITISDNNINMSMNYYTGINIIISFNLTISNNRITSSNGGTGIRVYRSRLVNLSGNKLINCSLAITSNSILDWTTLDIDYNNTINRKPIYYYKNISNVTIPANASQVYFVNCTNVVVSNLNLSHGGLYVIQSNNSEIKNNSLNNSYIYLFLSSYNLIINNTIISPGYGIRLEYSIKNEITENFINTVNNDAAIYLFESSNNNITNNIINVSDQGIYLYFLSNHNNIWNNTINTYSTNAIGIGNYYSSSCSFINNTINCYLEYSTGIQTSYSSDNVILENKVTTSSKCHGIYFYNSNRTILLKNNMTNCDIWFNIGGELLDYWNTFTIDSSNTVNNKPVYYYKNTSGLVVSGTAGEVIIANCSDIDISNQTFYNVMFFIAYSTDSKINNNLLFNSSIYLIKSNNIEICSNIITLNYRRSYGIYLKSSLNNELVGNDINNTQSYTNIFLTESNNNDIRYNILTGEYNSIGIQLGNSMKNNVTANVINSKYGQEGISIYGSNENNIAMNIINKSGNHACINIQSSFNNILSANTLNHLGSGWDAYGIHFQYSSNNDIKYNSINSRDIGIYLYRSSENKFIGNSITSYIIEEGVITITHYSDNNIFISNNITHSGYRGSGFWVMYSNNTYVSNCNITLEHSFEGHGFYLRGEFATLVNTTITSYEHSHGYDILIRGKGEITAINCSFQSVQLTESNGGILKVYNYLDVYTYHDNCTPISGVDIEVRDNGIPIYRSSGYGGSDSTTNIKGRIDNIVVPDRWYNYSNTPIENITSIKIKKLIDLTWKEHRLDINMSTSHDEVFYYYSAPPMPTGLNVTRVPGTNTLNISWDLNPDTVKYKVYSNRSGEWDVIANVTHPQNWTFDANLEDETWYYYTFQAWDGVGLSSDISNAVSYYLNDIIPPVIPKGLKVSPVFGGDALNISWDLNPDTPEYYYIYWLEPIVDDWRVIDTVAHPKFYYIFSNSDLVNGSVYKFKIRTTYEDNTVSDFSELVSVTHRDHLAPDTPKNLRATASSMNVIELNWVNSSDLDVEGYRIYVNGTGVGSGGPYHFIGNVFSSSYKVINLIEGTLYYFVISAYDEANNTSPLSDEVYDRTKVYIENPRIIDTIPIPNSKNVPVNITVLINFSLPMDITNVANRLIISPLTDHTLTWSDNNKVVALGFLDNLSYDSVYIITIGSAKAANGGVLDPWPFELRFTTQKEYEPPQIPSIKITSPEDYFKVKAGGMIIVSGTSSYIAANTKVTVRLENNTGYGKISTDSTWTVEIKVPKAPGNYTLTVTASALNDSVIVTVVEDDDGSGIKKPDRDKSENNGIFGLGVMIDLIFLAAIVIIIIIIFLFLLLKKKQKSDEMALAVEEEIVEASEAREILEPVDIDELMLKYELEELSDEDFEDDMAPGSEEEQEVVVEE